MRSAPSRNSTGPNLRAARSASTRLDRERAVERVEADLVVEQAVAAASAAEVAKALAVAVDVSLAGNCD